LKLSAFFLPIVMFFLFSPVEFIIFDNQPPHLLPPKLEPSISVRLACIPNDHPLSAFFFASCPKLPFS